ITVDYYERGPTNDPQQRLKFSALDVVPNTVIEWGESPNIEQFPIPNDSLSGLVRYAPDPNDLPLNQVTVFEYDLNGLSDMRFSNYRRWARRLIPQNEFRTEERIFNDLVPGPTAGKFIAMTPGEVHQHNIGPSEKKQVV